jgi:eukaryotic-like serine/threonine-protein kinase
MVTAAPTIVGRRYLLHESLGEGGMGAVFRATDRLSGQMVALKRVTTPSEALIFASRSADADFRRALAIEFKTLASLRHPNIISVLDYGFDDTRQPYFTMDLLQDAQTLFEAGHDLPRDKQVDLLIQVLQALAYLHRRGILHRDLKPGNILVVGGQVKVLDFGLSIGVQQEQGQGIVGTLAYAAPEILAGEPHTIPSDLYSLGVIAYELFTGKRPFNAISISSLMHDIMHTLPDFNADAFDPRTTAVLDRLLSKQPSERFTSANEVIAAFGKVLGKTVSQETAATRESYLQAAQFVGREKELATLNAALDAAQRSEGSAWLVGGESGVGKSRLLDELRTDALVRGIPVLRGQAISEGGLPYQVWRDVLRWLCLQTEIGGLEASVLKAVVPDIGTLIGRDVPDAPEIDPLASQERLLSAITGLLERQTSPIALILEDIHWAGSESLAVFGWLSPRIAGLPVMLIANYRDDEKPNLSRELSDMKVLKLNRLNTQQIAALSESMLSSAGRQPEVVDFLAKETEGNVFFLIEVVRVLAEEAGQLENVGIRTLPRSVTAKGVSEVVRRRLSKLPTDVRPLLNLAAIIGRQLDLPVLKTLAPEMEINGWLAVCADTAVLDVQDERWRFAHDKLREAIVADIPAAQKKDLHRRVAIALERVYPNTERPAILALHWGEAGDTAKEATYSALAGEQALDKSAYDEAIRFYNRALELGTNETPLRRAAWEQQLAEAYYNAARFSESLEHYRRALRTLDRPMPEKMGSKITTLLGQVGTQVSHRAAPKRYLGRRASEREKLLSASRAYDRLARMYYMHADQVSLLYSTLRKLNVSEAAGESPELGLAYAMISLTVGSVPLHGMARSYSRRAVEAAESIRDLSTLSSIFQITGMYEIGIGQQDAARTLIRRAIQYSQDAGHFRLMGEATVMLAELEYYANNYNAVIGAGSDLNEIVRRSGDKQQIAWVDMVLGMAHIRLGNNREAADCFGRAVEFLENDADRNSHLTCRAMLALALFRLGEYDKARMHAERALQMAITAPPVAFSAAEGCACPPDVFLSLLEVTPHDREQLMHLAEQGVKAVMKFAKIFPIAMPRALTLQGRLHLAKDEKDKALKVWNKAIETANTIKMPYERGLAEYRLGLHSDVESRRTHLKAARTAFESVGAAYDRMLVDDALSEMG